MPGFDTNRFTDLSEREAKHLICSICLNIFDGAVRSGCEHTFCKSCVQQWIDSNHKECPECRKEFKTRKRSDSTESTDNLVLIGNHIFKKNLLANSLVSELTIKCNFDFNGCQQSVKLESLSSHVKDCPHRFCAKCGFSLIGSVEHNCIELLKNDRKELKDKYEKQIQFTNELKDKYEKQMETINKLEDNNRELKTNLDKEHNCIELLKNDRNGLKINYQKVYQFYDEFKGKYENQLKINNNLNEENSELKTKLQSFESLLQKKSQNIIGDQRVLNNQFVYHSIKYINFGFVKTTLKRFKVYQDSFTFASVKGFDGLLHKMGLPFNGCEGVVYCNHPPLRIIMIRPERGYCHQIQKILGFDSNKTQYFNVDSKFPRNNILLVFKDDTQQFERCVRIMESVKTQTKVMAITESLAKSFIASFDSYSIVTPNLIAQNPPCSKNRRSLEG